MLRQKLFKEERRTRSHRLIVRGAVFESIVPEAKGMTNEESATFLLLLCHVYFSFFQALNLNFPVIQTESCLLNLFNLNQQHHRSTHFITHSRHTHHICRRHCFLNSLNLKTTFYKWIQYLR